MKLIQKIMGDVALELAVMAGVLVATLAFSRVIWHNIVRGWIYITVTPNESNHNKMMGVLSEIEKKHDHIKDTVIENTVSIRKIEETLECIIKEVKRR